MNVPAVIAVSVCTNLCASEWIGTTLGRMVAGPSARHARSVSIALGKRSFALRASAFATSASSPGGTGTCAKLRKERAVRSSLLAIIAICPGASCASRPESASKMTIANE